MRAMWRWTCVVALTIGVASAAAQKPAISKTLERIDGCVLVPDRWNDGDTLRARLPNGREETFRLYFVDAPEVKTRLLDRNSDQMAYFRIERDAVNQLAKEASAFTQTALAEPFTIYTKWRPVFSSPRYYAFVVSGGGTSLIEALVSHGLAQIHGPSAQAPDGTPRDKYRARLLKLERNAKEQGLGGWKR